MRYFAAILFCALTVSCVTAYAQTKLSQGTQLPAELAAFDLVVIDEASQSDILMNRTSVPYD